MTTGRIVAQLSAGRVVWWACLAGLGLVVSCAAPPKQDTQAGAQPPPAAAQPAAKDATAAKAPAPAAADPAKQPAKAPPAAAPTTRPATTRPATTRPAATRPTTRPANATKSPAKGPATAAKTPEKAASKPALGPHETEPGIIDEKVAEAELSKMTEAELIKYIQDAVAKVKENHPELAQANASAADDVVTPPPSPANPPKPGQPPSTQPTSKPAPTSQANCHGNPGTQALVPPPEGSPQPKCVCKEPKVSLGSVWKSGKPVVATFEIANEGEAPLAIRLQGG